MKKALFFISLAAMLAVPAVAQQSRTRFLKGAFGVSGMLIGDNLMGPHSGYCSINFTAGSLFYRAHSGLLQVSFPYTTTDSAGNVSANTFTSKKINPYPHPRPLYGGSFEVGNVMHFANVHISGSSGAIKYSLGYGLNIYTDLFMHEPRQLEERLLIIKPSVNIEMGRYYENDLSSIDNTGVTINALGNTADAFYTFKSDKHKVYHPAKRLDVLFAQNNYSLVPMLSISTNRYRYMLNVQLDMGYYFTLSEKSGVQFQQYSDGDTYKHNVKAPGVVDIADSRITATFDNKPISKSPYTFSGFFAGVTVGLNINSRVMNFGS